MSTADGVTHRLSTVKTRFSDWVALFARLAIAIAALTALQYSTVRERGWVDVSDSRRCAAGLIEHADQLSSGGCVYADAIVKGDALHRAFVITGPNGSSVRTMHAERVWSDGKVAAEHWTAQSWVLISIAAVAVLFPGWLLLGRVIPSDDGANLDGRWRRTVASVILIAACAIYVFPSVREYVAMYRIQSNEARIRSNDMDVTPTFVSKESVGPFYRLGTGYYARAVRLAYSGCRFYSSDGTPLAADAYKVGEPVAPSSLPADVRFGGACLFPEYDPNLDR
ncbi:hypothetical protein [Paraburkholderia sp. SIMBA_054]|uniref:hypothetical protein n=1 Tax=Paraburkholderia sp. SIMBA_054 TaxID=3085795 RepID=UPI00397B5089